MDRRKGVPTKGGCEVRERKEWGASGRMGVDSQHGGARVRRLFPRDEVGDGEGTGGMAARGGATSRVFRRVTSEVEGVVRVTRAAADAAVRRARRIFFRDAG